MQVVWEVHKHWSSTRVKARRCISAVDSWWYACYMPTMDDWITPCVLISLERPTTTVARTLHASPGNGLRLALPGLFWLTNPSLSLRKYKIYIKFEAMLTISNIFSFWGSVLHTYFLTYLFTYSLTYLLTYYILRRQLRHGTKRMVSRLTAEI